MNGHKGVFIPLINAPFESNIVISCSHNKVKSQNSRAHLLENAFQILTLGLPELNLYKWPWVETFQQRLGRVSLEHISDLMCPVNDDRLNGMHQASVVGIISAMNENIQIIINNKMTVWLEWDGF